MIPCNSDAETFLTNCTLSRRLSLSLLPTEPPSAAACPLKTAAPDLFHQPHFV